MPDNILVDLLAKLENAKSMTCVQGGSGALQRGYFITDDEMVSVKTNLRTLARNEKGNPHG